MSRSTARPPLPTYALVIVAVTTAGFAIASVGARGAGLGRARAASCFSAHRCLRGAGPPRESWSGQRSLGFVLFVLALGVIVNAVSRHGVEHALHRIVPSGTSLLALLAIAFIAAIAANLANNLPATLALAPVVAGHPAAVLAVLLGRQHRPERDLRRLAGDLALAAAAAGGRIGPAPASSIATGCCRCRSILAAATGALWLVA